MYNNLRVLSLNPAMLQHPQLRTKTANVYASNEQRRKTYRTFHQNTELKIYRNQ